MLMKTRPPFWLICVFIFVAFGEARIGDRRARAEAPGEDTDDDPEVAPPTNLTADVLSNTSIHVTWSYGLKQPFLFNLTCCSADEVPCFPIYLDGYERAHSFGKLKPGTAYNISVSAIDAAKESAPAVAYATTYANAPNVTGLELKVLGISSIEVSWTPSEVAVTRYEIKTCPVEGGPCVDANTTDKKSYVIENLRPGTEYEVSVQSVIQRRSFISYGVPTTARATTEYWVPPVTNLELHCPASGVIVASWTLKNQSLVDAVHIIACPPDEQDCRRVNVTPSDTSVKFQKLLAGVEYTVNVTTFHTSGEETRRGDTRTAKIVTPPNPPAKVGNLKYEVSNVTNLNASWVKPANQATQVDGYVLSCKKVGGNETRSEEVPATESHVSAELDLEEPLSDFECSVWAYVNYSETRVNGTITRFPAETESPAPSKVLDLKFGVLNVTTLNVSWDRPSVAPWGITGYVVDCKRSDSNKTVVVKFEDRKEEHVNEHVNLKEQLTNFSCNVFAYLQEGGKSYNGNATNFEVETDGIAAPKNVELVERTATSFTFKWDTDPKAPNYTIDVKRQAEVDVSVPWTESVFVERNGTVTHNVTNLTPATLYAVSIRNCADYCGKEFTLEQETRVAAPSAARNLTARVEQYVNVTLSWMKPAVPNGPIDGYKVKVYDTERNQTFPNDLKATSVTLNVVYKFTDFNVTVTPYNLDDNNTLLGPSISITFSSTGEGPVPPRPHVEDVKDHSVRVTWDAPKDKNHTILGYKVTLTPGGKNFSTNSTNVTLTDLQAWTQYSVYVASCTNSTECGIPKSAMFLTDVDAPSAPENLTVLSFGAHWVDVSWKAPEHPNGPLSGYNVTLKNGSELVWATTTKTSHNITGLEPGTEYEISVYAYNTGKQGEKKGPITSFTAQTQSEASSGGGVSGAVIAAAVLIPLLVIALVVGYFVYKKYGKRGGESQLLISSQGGS